MVDTNAQYEIHHYYRTSGLLVLQEAHSGDDDLKYTSPERSTVCKRNRTFIESLGFDILLYCITILRWAPLYYNRRPTLTEINN
uniref:Uncharacterized protein n=1 Tax=Glossina palpalis gambiensis TaxID=67801 RepID=A0A1B0BBM3_9MUSC